MEIIDLENVRDDLQTPEMCLAAVTQNGLSLKYVKMISKHLKFI